MIRKVIKLAGGFLLSWSLQAQMPSSYCYYRGEKIELTVDRSHVYVVAEEEYLQSASSKQWIEKFDMEQIGGNQQTQNMGKVINTVSQQQKKGEKA